MSVFHLCFGKANPERANGVNRVVHGLATAQARLGADVAVWGMSRTLDAETHARAYPLRVFRWTERRALDVELARALAQLPAGALVHLHGGYQPEFRAAARVLAQHHVPWVVTPHGAYRTEVVRQSWLKKRVYLALFDGPLLQRARAVHVFSAREAAELAAFVPGAHTVVLPNGIDPAEFAPRALDADPARAPAFAFCGRLAEYTKGLDLLLDGWGRYRARGGRGTLALIGDGPDRAALEQRAAALGPEARVTFRGALFGAEKLAALRACDVFLHPSRHEGMPVSVLEAAALGLACVLSDETNLAEPFARRGAGLVLARNDAEHIARALLDCDTLARRGELVRLGASARGLALDEHDWRHIAARAASLLYGSAPLAGVRAA